MVETFEESFAQLQAAIQHPAEEIGFRSYQGAVTYLIDIRNFYVVPFNLYRMLHIMEQPGSIMLDYSQYSTAIYFSPQLNQHVRGRVNLVNPSGSCEMFAMDYGVIDEGVTPKNIFHLLHPEAEVVPGLAQLCELSMCYPREHGEFTSEAQRYFKYLMGEKGESLRFTVKEKYIHKLAVLVMSCKSDPNDVSTSMTFCGHSNLFAGPLRHYY